MSQPSPKKDSGNDGMNRFASNIALLMENTFKFTVGVCTVGARQIPYKSQTFLYSFFYALAGSNALAIIPPKRLGAYLRDHEWPAFIQKILLFQDYRTFRICIYSLLVLTTVLFVFGITNFIRQKRLQKGLDSLRLGSEENRPRIISVKITDDRKTRIKIVSVGVGYEKLQSRKGDLETGFNQTIEAIYPEEGHPQIINISMSKIPLPKMLLYEDCAKDLMREGDLLIGQSRQGFIVQNIADLPHLLIAGTTGAGKSVFFKQAIISLMESTPSSIFYLMDFKRGVEFGAFSSIPNTSIVKTKGAALNTLKSVYTEMQARFDFLEKEKITKISPDTHKMPRIFLAIDEASELLAVPDRFNADKDTVAECRKIVNDIAKLGRAACVHIIIATQKVSKAVIDMALQENIGGRMAFRMATLANSTQVIGAKEAREIPEIPGRAIWNFGTKFIEVQVPFMDEKYLAKKIKQIAISRAAFKTETKNETSLNSEGKTADGTSELNMEELANK